MAANAESGSITETDTDTDVEAEGGVGVSSDIGASAPERCPVCDAGYESVSVHGTGLMVNLLDNERYRRVCFEPVSEDGPRIRFYHHTHEQTAFTK